MLDSTQSREGNDVCDDEPPMYVQRPNSARSQDVTHILVRTFRELFTRDVIAPDVVQYLNTSRCSDDEYHQQYVDALMKVCVTRSFIYYGVYLNTNVNGNYEAVFYIQSCKLSERFSKSNLFCD